MNNLRNEDGEGTRAHDPAGGAATSIAITDEPFWRTAVGKHSDYYLPHFAKYEKGERSFPSWHWPAFFALGWWALYRKAWGGAALFFSLPVLVVAPLLIAARLVAPGNEIASSTAIWIGGLLCAGLAAMLANSLYYRRVKALVQKARTQYPNADLQLAFLRTKGGTISVAAVIGLGICLSVLAMLLTLVADLALPAYQSFSSFSRGFAYQEKGDNESAIREYDQALRGDPNNSVTLVNRGNAYRDNGDYERAFQDYDQARRLSPNDALVFINRGVAYSHIGDMDRAIESYDEAIRRDSHNALVFSNRGYAYATKGEYALAIVDLDRALRLDRNLVHAIANRGLVYYFQGQFEAAAQDFARAQQLEPRSPHRVLWLYLARARAAHNAVDQLALRNELAQAGMRFDLAEWPGPVFSLYLGTIDEEPVLAAAGADTKYARALQSEAYFFIGQNLVLENRTKEAAKMFQATLATGVTRSVCYDGAKAELKRIAQ